jgi:hypothetical protein
MVAAPGRAVVIELSVISEGQAMSDDTSRGAAASILAGFALLIAMVVSRWLLREHEDLARGIAFAAVAVGALFAVAVVVRRAAGKSSRAFADGLLITGAGLASYSALSLFFSSGAAISQRLAIFFTAVGVVLGLTGWRLR